MSLKLPPHSSHRLAAQPRPLGVALRVLGARAPGRVLEGQRRLRRALRRALRHSPLVLIASAAAAAVFGFDDVGLWLRAALAQAA